MRGSSKASGDSARINNRSPRILFLNTRDSLGADVAVHLLLARALVRAQARVWAATSTYEAPGASARAELESIANLTVLPLDLGRPLTGHRGMARVLAVLRNVRSVANLLCLARFCRRERIDVIHVTERPRDSLFGFLLARLSGSACLVHAHTSYYPHDGSRIGDWLLRHVDVVVGVSRFTAETFVRDARVPADRVFTVHNAVDCGFYRPDVPATERFAMRNRLGVPAEAPLIGCVARLSRWKDQATLLDALVAVRREVPGVRLVLAGQVTDLAPDGRGDYKDYLIRRIAALGLGDAVIFAGFVPKCEMPGFYAALDVLAHPSLEEPFGLALVEAMASARPVVAVGAGGVPEIIRDGVDGLLVPRERAEMLAAALVRVLCEPTFARRLADSGCAHVRAVFNPDHQAAVILGIYGHILAVRAGGNGAAQTTAQRTSEMAASPAAGGPTRDERSRL